MSQFRKAIPVSNRNPIVGGHRYDNRNLLPGLAYIDVLYQAFASHGFDMALLELRDFAIHRPLLVGPDSTIELSIDATCGDGRRWDVQVTGRPRGRAGDVAVRYAVATMIARDTPVRFDETIDPQAWRETPGAMLPLDEVYDACAAQGLEHDAFMRGKGVVHATDASIHVDCGLSVETGADGLLFHPALLDACVVAATTMLASLDDGAYEPALPLSYDAFRACGPIASSCLARVRRDSVGQRNDLTSLSVEFFDATGRKLAELVNFTSKRLRGKLAEKPVAQALPEQAFAAPPPRVALASTLLHAVREIVARRVRNGHGQVLDDAGFYEMGIDSTDLLELVQDMEPLLRRKLPPTLLFQYSTIADVVEHLASLAGTHAVAARVPAVVAPAPTIDSPRADSDTRIAIVGLSGRFPGAADVDALWARLRAGEDCVTTVPSDRWDADRFYDPEKGAPGHSYCKWGGFIDGVAQFDALFFGMSPREARYTDPQQRLFLETTWNLLEGAGYTRERLKSGYGGRVGVYVGSMYSHYDRLRTPGEGEHDLQSFQGGIANRVSHYFGLSGPSLAMDTMCSSSSLCLHMACADLLAGACDMAIAGGVNLSIDGRKFVSLSQAHLLGSRFEGRPFGDGDGYLPAEAVGAVLLKRLDRAERDGDDILGLIAASATNHNGSGQAYGVPDAHSQAELMREVLRRADVEPGWVNHVEAAASGSSVGDAIEVAALAQVFGGGACAIGSVKSAIGHAEAASGITQLAKVLLQLRHGELAPVIHGEAANPMIDWSGGLRLQRELAPWPRVGDAPRAHHGIVPRRAIVNSVGAGGTNVSLLVEEYAAPARARSANGRRPRPMVFSARTAEALRAVVARMLDWLEANEGVDGADLAYTLQSCREAMAYRLAVVVEDIPILRETLRAYLDGTTVPTPWHEGDARSAASLQGLAPGPLARDLLQGAIAQGDIARVATLWAQHVPVDWAALRHGDAFRRLPLPTYPFERERLWIADDPVSSSMGADDRVGSSTSIADAIVETLCAALDLRRERIDTSRPLREYGVDSLVGTGLLRVLNRRFDTRLLGRDLFDHPSVEALALRAEALRLPEDGEPIEAATRGIADDAPFRAALRDYKAGALSHEQVKALIERSFAA